MDSLKLSYNPKEFRGAMYQISYHLQESSPKNLNHKELEYWVMTSYMYKLRYQKYHKEE